MSESFMMVLFAFTVLSAFVAIFLSDLLSSIIAMSVFSTLLAIIFVILQAPDVALTQAIINSGLLTSLFLVAFSRTRKDDLKDR